jgi:hypothetical protein
MPLDREQPRFVGGGLCGFNQLVVGPSTCDQPRRKVTDSLMV